MVDFFCNIIMLIDCAVLMCAIISSFIGQGLVEVSEEYQIYEDDNQKYIKPKGEHLIKTRYRAKMLATLMLLNFIAILLKSY